MDRLENLIMADKQPAPTNQQIDYERDPVVTEGFVWAAQTCLLFRRLSQHTYD